MATHTLVMSSTNLGCICVSQIATLSDADVASLTQAIVDDQKIINTVQYGQNYSTLQVGSIITATSTTTLGTLTSVALGSGPALTNTLIGDFIYGQGIKPGTTITSVSGSGTNFTLGLSQNPNVGVVAFTAVITQTPQTNWYFKNGLLIIPSRNCVYTLLPGDVVCVDPSGWPFVLSGTAVNIPGGAWIFT